MEIKGNYINIKTHQKLPYTFTFKKNQDKLPSNIFFKSHRSEILNF